MICTIENGLTRSGPRSLSVTMQDSKDLSPPMPVATAAPTRSGIDAMSSPESRFRLAGGGEREMGEAVHAPRRLVLDPHRRIEVLDLAGERDGEVRRVELRDRAGAGLPGDERRPRRLEVVSERCHHAEAGDDNPAPAVGRAHGR